MVRLRLGGLRAPVSTGVAVVSFVALIPGPFHTSFGGTHSAAAPLFEADTPDRYRVTRPTSFRKFVVAPPALNAACTTFDRPKAKLIWSTVNSRMIGAGFPFCSQAARNRR